MTRNSKRQRGLRENVPWLVLGNALYALGYWLQFVVLARVWGPDAVGAYAYALALTSPPMGFANLQLRGLLASDTNSAFAFREYFALRVAAIIAVVLAILAAALASTDRTRVFPVLVPVCLMRAADALSDIYYGWWQRREHMAVVGFGFAIGGTASVALMAVAAFLGGSVPVAASGAAAGSFCALGFVHFRTRAAWCELAQSQPSTPLSWLRLLRLALQGAPLGVITLLGSLQANIPRYFIRLAVGEAALGLFAAANQLPASGGVLVGALGAAAVPRLAALYARKELRAFYFLTRKLLLVAAVLAAAGVGTVALAGRQVLTLLYRPEFAAADRLLLVLSGAAGIGFLASLLGYALTSARIIAVQPVILLVAIATMAVGCATLVHRFGAVGAAWAVLIGSLVQALASAAALRLCSHTAPGESRQAPSIP